MKKMKTTKFTAVIMISAMLLQSTAFALTPEEYFDRAAIAHESTYTISEGVDYTESVIHDSSLGYQKAYRFEFSENDLSELIFAQGESIYSRKSMETLINSVGDDDGIAVGAINADFFNMSTGVPESGYIKDGVLYTSDRDNYCFAKNTDGTYFFGIPKVRLSMLRGETEYNIIFLNKELTNYGIYMYTDVYSDSTKISVPTTELVLYPYSDMKTPYELAVMYFGNDSVPEDIYVEIMPEDLQSVEISEESVTSEAESGELYNDVDAQIGPDYSQESSFASDSDADIADFDEDEGEEVISESEEPVYNENNNPVYAFNEKYRLVVEMYAFDNGYVRFGENYFIIEKAEPRIGQSQNAVVAETRRNTKGESLEIPEGSYVLAADNSGYGYTLGNFACGETVTLNVKGDESFYDVTDAIGCGCMIVRDGKIIEDKTLAHYSAANPRTAIGIKEDGSVVLFAVDGRKPGTSTGLKLSELSAEMIRAGCVEAANFDGGGSTTVKVLLSLPDRLTTVNSPSDGSERRISNAVVITNNSEKTGEEVYSYIDREISYVMPHSSMPVGGSISYFDENHYYVPTSQADSEDFEYSPENGYLSDGLYYPDGFTGTDIIISNHISGHSNTAAKIISTDKVDKITLTADKTEMYLDESISLTAQSELYGFKVYGDNSEYSWGVSDDNGYVLEDGTYFPAVSNENVEIFAYYGDTFGKISIKVKPFPFNDIRGHWAVRYASTLYEEGISIGEITDDGRMYFPERVYTRNEFCTMLTRVMGLTVASDTVEKAVLTEEDNNGGGITEITDVQDSLTDTIAENIIDTDIESYTGSEEQVCNEKEIQQETSCENFYGKTLFLDDGDIPEWAYDSVCALYDRGLLADFAHYSDNGMMFDGSAPVTRREVMTVIGRICQTALDDFEINFTDYDFSDSDSQFVKNAVFAGIIEGYEDGSIRPDAQLTRAEGAAIFVRLFDVIND